jgi:hypothetical protein
MTMAAASASPDAPGRGDSPDNCFYPDRMTLGPDGMLHLAGVFRYNSSTPRRARSGYQTNHRYVYLRSPDGGTTWQRSDGSPIDLPVVEAAWFQSLGASHVPGNRRGHPRGLQHHEQSGMTTDSAGRPIIANWWAAMPSAATTPANTTSSSTTAPPGSGAPSPHATSTTRPPSIRTGALNSSRMGRPVVLTDADDRIIVVYNDNRFPGITVVFSEPLAQDPDRNTGPG